MNDIVPGVQMWSLFMDDLGYSFNGFAVATGGGLSYNLSSALSICAPAGRLPAPRSVMKSKRRRT